MELTDQMDGPDFAAWREKLGFTQQGLADAFGVNRVTVAKWEGDVLPIRRVTVLAMERLEASQKVRGSRAEKK